MLLAGVEGGRNLWVRWHSLKNPCFYVFPKCHLKNIYKLYKGHATFVFSPWKGVRGFEKVEKHLLSYRGEKKMIGRLSSF